MSGPWEMFGGSGDAPSSSGKNPWEQDWGNRPDGSKKAQGYYGVLQRPDGDVSTEISIGVDIDGKEMDIPTLVPGLDKSEVDHLLNMKGDERIPESIIRKAVGHARKRISEGRDVFAGPEDQVIKLGE
jgi:hypothetical protein